MDKTSFHLLILTPYGHYFEGDVAFLEVHSEEYNLGILPGHAPLVSTLAISKMTIKAMGKVSVYAIGGGVINVEKERVTLILNSVERDDEIDVARAQEAKKRAEDRLKDAKNNETIDVNRAQFAFMRAVNRIETKSKGRN